MEQLKALLYPITSNNNNNCNKKIAANFLLSF